MKDYYLLISILTLLLTLDTARSLSMVPTHCKYGTDPLCGECLTGRCGICWESYSDYQGVCRKPETSIENCQRYLEKDTCLKCKDYYHLDIEGQCVPNSIDKCREQIDNKCAKCNGVRVTDSGTCDSSEKCNDNCLSCMLLDSKEKCIECGPGYTLTSYESSDKNSKYYYTSCDKQNSWSNSCEMYIMSTCLRCQFGAYIKTPFEKGSNCAFSAILNTSHYLFLCVLFLISK